MKLKDAVFKIRMYLATEWGAYRYDGLFPDIRGYPMAQVLYKDGNKSVPMAIGNCVDYAAMFGGKVIQIESE